MNTRLLSLDIFRGATVAAMILVNNPGSWSSIYAPLEHAKWNGCTPTDLIFPFFLFIVGVSIAYALSAKKAIVEDRADIIKSICIRAAKLFALGFFLALFPKFDFSSVRIMGVLQRIGLVYLMASLLFIYTKPQAIAFITAGILMLYYGLMTFVPVPGQGFATLEPGTNLAAWVDRLILTESHIWTQSKTWDPEGILSTLPALCTALLGVLTGSWMRAQVDNTIKIRRMYAFAGLGIAVGLLWSLVFPLNKSLWTSSFVLYTAGWATAVLASVYWLADIKGYKRFSTPFVAFGVNAITAFFLSGFILKSLWLIELNDPGAKLVNIQSWAYTTYILPYFSPVNASLLHALIWVAFFTAMTMWMYRRKIFIKV